MKRKRKGGKNNNNNKSCVFKMLFGVISCVAVYLYYRILMLDGKRGKTSSKTRIETRDGIFEFDGRKAIVTNRMGNIEETIVLNSLFEIHESNMIYTFEMCELMHQEKVQLTYRCGANLIVEWSIQAEEKYFRITTKVRSNQATSISLQRLVGIGLTPQDEVATSGHVPGSPLILKSFFYSFESPLSETYKSGKRFISSSLTNVMSDIKYTAVLGLVNESVRRDVLHYLLHARSQRKLRAFKPWLHYNSWFDFWSWQEPDKSFQATRMMNEKNCMNRIESVTRELEHVDSFLLDDGWDDKEGNNMWSFERHNFPNGFERVGTFSEKKHTGIGVWLSPWGGYGDAKTRRLELGKQLGYEVNDAGFSISGSKYHERFREIALEFVEKYKVNMFKFDGMAGENAASEMTSLMSLIDELRDASSKPLFISCTTGTWPSIFYMLHCDSIWRGGTDVGFYGEYSLPTH